MTLKFYYGNVYKIVSIRERHLFHMSLYKVSYYGCFFTLF